MTATRGSKVWNSVAIEVETEVRAVVAMAVRAGGKTYASTNRASDSSMMSSIKLAIEFVPP